MEGRVLSVLNNLISQPEIINVGEAGILVMNPLPLLLLSS